VIPYMILPQALPHCGCKHIGAPERGRQDKARLPAHIEGERGNGGCKGGSGRDGDPGVGA
jgi:hypothetical protein